jgi:peptidoglycan/LPS O-acetylase OafA/YrhL
MIVKFHFIEALRFITSIAVVVAHYQFFFYPRTSFSTLQVLSDPSMQPFFFFLQAFYIKGYYAVPIFWGISGFIFALVYLEQTNKISGKKFFFNRFSRLYPLHFLTLIFVTVLQITNYYILGKHQILENNDILRFVLHIFFVSGWEGESFNLPIWSVSVEILIYFTFFISIVYLKKFGVKYAILIYTLATITDKFLLSSLGLESSWFVDCFRLFFTGIIIYYLNLKFKEKKYLIPLSGLLIALSFVGNFKIFIFTPGILLFFISLEYLIKSDKKKKLDIFGNLTYSMYLLHIPIMLSIILTIFLLGLPDTIFLNNIFFLSYLLSVLLLSYISYRYYEKPLSKFIRKKIN